MLKRQTTIFLNRSKYLKNISQKYIDGKYVQEKMFNIIRKVQIVITMKYDYKITRRAKIKSNDLLTVGKNVGQSELTFIVGGNVKWFNYSGKSLIV